MIDQLTPLSPETQNLIGYLRDKIKEQQDGFKFRRNKNRNLAIRIKLALIFLSAVVTVLLGLKIESAASVFTNIAFVISALVTALAAVEEFFEYRGLWIRYNLTFTQLKSLQDDLEYLLLREKDETALISKLDEIHKRLKDILDTTNSDWISLRKKDVEK
jgi:hypothetical protein